MTSASVSALAQDPLSSPPLEIVITGRRLPAPATVGHFVRNVATPVAGQLAVFRQPICPNALGLDPDAAAKVVARIRTVAKVAGVPLAGERCDPNLTLIIAADGPAFMRDVVRLRPGSFKFMATEEQVRLISSPGPAWSWRTIGTHTEDGKSNAANDPALIFGGGTRGGSMTGMQTRSSSLTQLQVRKDVDDAYVVIDERWLGEKTPTQLADYTLMRAVAGAQPPVTALDTGSILSLFDKDSVTPASLSYLDLAFLTTVYELPMNLTYSQQITAIASRINNYNTAQKARAALRDAQN